MNISPVPEKLLVSPAGASGTPEGAVVTADAESQQRRLMSVANRVENAQDDTELRKACADFEALFLHKLLKVMRGTIPESGLLDHGLSHDIYTDMLDEKLADVAAHSGKGTGLGERLYRDMSRAYSDNAGKTTGAYGFAQKTNGTDIEI